MGFRVVEELARRRGVRLAGGECSSRVGAVEEPGLPEQPSVVLLVQPQTYMNRSGYAARCLAERHGLAPGDFLIVYDEVNLPLGRLRLRRGGSPAGHRGLESIIENLRTDEVPRLRLGVAPEAGPPPGADLADFVLGPFAQEEAEAAEAMIRRAADAVEAWLTQPIEAAMNVFNR